MDTICIDIDTDDDDDDDDDDRIFIILFVISASTNILIGIIFSTCCLWRIRRK